MYYEEKIIDGILHWRSTPTGAWIAKTPEQLTIRIEELEAAQAQAVPDGWQLVPLEPTEEMERAGWDVGGLVTPYKTYRAMLHTAPTPAGSQQSELAAEYARGRNDGWGAAKLHSAQQPPAANAAQDVRNQALEEVAFYFDGCSESGLWSSIDVASAIRALKTPAKREG